MSTLPYDARVQISQSTIDTVTGLFNATGQIGQNSQPGCEFECLCRLQLDYDLRFPGFLTTENAHLLGAIAHHDLLVGKMDNRDSVLDHLVNLYSQANHP